jgi:antitoxin component of MazEF toxin-antitoxin module
MSQRLTKTGNSLAVVIEKTILEATGIGPETPLEISTDGDVIVISPVRNEERTAKLRRGMETIHHRYAGAFRRLAD